MVFDTIEINLVFNKLFLNSRLITQRAVVSRYKGSVLVRWVPGAGAGTSAKQKSK